MSHFPPGTHEPPDPSVVTKVGTPSIPVQIGLLSRYSLVLSCVVCLEIEKEQHCYFRAREDWELSSSLAGKIFGLPPKIRLPSTTNTIPVPEPR